MSDKLSCPICGALSTNKSDESCTKCDMTADLVWQTWQAKVAAAKRLCPHGYPSRAICKECADYRADEVRAEKKDERDD